jgi:hypothetical protein
VRFEIAPSVISLGWIVALLVLILVIVFAVLAQIPLLLAGLIGGVALSRLL